MKKLKIIKLRITGCSMSDKYDDCWYSNKIGKKIYFFDNMFTDYGDKAESLWKAKVPTTLYAHIKDTNYDIYLRKKKLKKINKLNKD